MVEHDDPSVEQLNEEADIAADYLEGLLDIADYDGDIEMGVRNGRAVVQIVADDNTDIKNLIGKDGEVVEALQRLTRLAVQEKTGERSHLILDVDGYLRRKHDRLERKALDAVDEAKATGEPVDLEPMNSYERKIIHDVVREEGLKSRSHGEDPHRYVTVYVKAADTDDDEDGADEEFEFEEPVTAVVTGVDLVDDEIVEVADVIEVADVDEVDQAVDSPDDEDLAEGTVDDDPDALIGDDGSAAASDPSGAASSRK